MIGPHRVRQTAFAPNESYMHLAAKKVLAEWLDAGLLPPIACRDSGYWLEYPIGIGGEGVNPTWDEVEFWEHRGMEVPVVADLNAHGIRVACVCDVGIRHKGMLGAVVEVVHSHPTPGWKRDFLAYHDVDLIEVEAAAVLRHTKRPDQLPLWTPGKPGSSRKRSRGGMRP